eukprot:scaffold2394_cov276-Pinguiococcus_pyrenoidosus.AAC.3
MQRRPSVFPCAMLVRARAEQQLYCGCMATERRNQKWSGAGLTGCIGIRFALKQERYRCGVPEAAS